MSALTPENPSFNELFAILDKNAQYFRDNNAPDIDKLISVVESSRDAYLGCQSRLESIEQALKLVFSDLEAKPEQN